MQEREVNLVKIDKPIKTGLLLGIGFAVVLPVVMFAAGLVVVIALMLVGGY